MRNGVIDYSALSHNLERLQTTKIKGIVVNGSNGEFPQLSERERIELVGRVREKFNDKDRIVVANSGCESTYQTIRMTNKMAAAGADVALVITPSFFKEKMTSTCFLNHYRKVADESNIPIMLYNVPKFTHVALDKGDVIQLAKHENILGIKESDAKNIKDTAEILDHVDRNNFGIMSGSVGYMKKQHDMGAIGCIGALANIFPTYVTEVYNLDLSNEDRDRLEDDLGGLHDLISGSHGISGLKYAMGLEGFKGGYCREPLLPLSSVEQSAIERAVDDFHTKND